MGSLATLRLVVEPEQAEVLADAALAIRDQQAAAQRRRAYGNAAGFDVARSQQRMREARDLSDELLDDSPMVDVPAPLADAIRCYLAERMGSAMTELVEDAGTIPLGDHIARADSTWRLLLQLDAAARLLMPVS